MLGPQGTFLFHRLVLHGTLFKILLFKRYFRRNRALKSLHSQEFDILTQPLTEGIVFPVLQGLLVEIDWSFVIECLYDFVSSTLEVHLLESNRTFQSVWSMSPSGCHTTLELFRRSGSKATIGSKMSVSHRMADAFLPKNDFHFTSSNNNMQNIFYSNWHFFRFTWS